MTVKTLRVGIIGCGVIGPTHAECFRQLAGVELQWACDLDLAKAECVAEQYGIPHVTADHADVLADPEVDCVTVCTDHASHVPIVTAAMESGKHVLCEKALVANRQGLDRMFRVHQAHPKLVFGAVSQHRFDAVNQRLKDYVDEGILGEPLMASVHLRCYRSNAYYEADAWRGTWTEEGGSVLINQAIHFIDVLLWIMGGAESLCGAHTNRTHQGVIETEDTAAALLRFRNGAIGTIEATSSSNLDWDHILSLYGSEGAVEIRDGKPVLVRFRDAALQQRIEKDLKTCREAPATPSGKPYYGGGHVGQVADFVAAIRENRDPFVSAADVRHAVDVVLGIYESQAIGEWVTLR